MSCLRMVGAARFERPTPPAPKTLDTLIWASIDSTTCIVRLLDLVGTTSYNFDYNLQFRPQSNRQNPTRSPDGNASRKINATVSGARTCCCDRGSPRCPPPLPVSESAASI